MFGWIRKVFRKSRSSRTIKEDSDFRLSAQVAREAQFVKSHLQLKVIGFSDSESLKLAAILKNSGLSSDVIRILLENAERDASAKRLLKDLLTRGEFPSPPAASSPI